jgi:hypothetical protein
VLKSFWVISSVNAELKTNISQTSSISITRVDVNNNPDNGDRNLEMLVFKSATTRLIAQEYFSTHIR